MESLLKKPNFIYFILIFVAGFFLYRVTFSTSIYGDEWKVFWLGKSVLETKGNILNQQSTDLSYLFEIVIFNFFSKLFGYDGAYYYIFSYLCRFLASLSLFWFLRKRNISEFPAFLGTLLFIVSPIGIETTDWVRNFDSYLSIPIFLFAINTALEIKGIRDSFKLFTSLISIILINTTRSHGVIFIIVGLLLLKGLIYKKSRVIALYSSLFFLLLYVAFSTTKIFGGQMGNLFLDFNFTDFWHSLFGNIGNTLIPNKDFRLLNFVIVSSILVIWKNYKYLNLGAIFFTVLIFYLIFPNSRVSDSSEIMGVYFFTLLILFIAIELKNKKYQDSFLTFFIASLSFSFMVIPLIRIPQIHADSEHRYLIYSSLVVPLIIASAANLMSKRGKLYYGVIGATAILIITFTFQGLNYLTLQNRAHGKAYTNLIWSQLTDSFENYNITDKKVSVIILTDSETYPRVVGSVAFGFNYHFGLIYNIWEDEKLPPVWVIVGSIIDRSAIPPIVLSPDKEILVFEIKGTSVKDITPKAKF